MILGSLHPTPGALLLVIGLLIMLAFYGWLARRSHVHALLGTQDFGLPDALFAGVLALWMISVISHGFDAPQKITLEAIIANSILYGALVLGIVGVIGFQRHSVISLFQLEFSRFPKAASRGLLWLVITYPLILVTQSTVQQFTGSRDDSQEIVRYFIGHASFLNRSAVILMAVVVAPIAEEIIFRGYFYGIIRRYGGRIPAILTSSLLFAAIHVHLPSFPGLFLLALILCLVYERTGSLWANITLHAAFNAITIISLILCPDLAS
jgi:membrane protease YdiL (CAAX protease family)